MHSDILKQDDHHVLVLSHVTHLLCCFQHLKIDRNLEMWTVERCWLCQDNKCGHFTVHLALMTGNIRVKCHLVHFIFNKQSTCNAIVLPIILVYLVFRLLNFSWVKYLFVWLFGLFRRWTTSPGMVITITCERWWPWQGDFSSLNNSFSFFFLFRKYGVASSVWQSGALSIIRANADVLVIFLYRYFSFLFLLQKISSCKFCVTKWGLFPLSKQMFLHLHQQSNGLGANNIPLIYI